jgi:hypothetical protein
MPMPPTPTAPPAATTVLPAGTPVSARVVTLGANVRDMPHRRGSQVLEVLHQGMPVTLTAQFADRTWFRVRSAAGVEGWMHHSVLDIDPRVLGQVPVATGELVAGGMTMLLPGGVPPTHAPEPAPPATADGVIVTAMPDADPVDSGGGGGAAVLDMLVPLVLHACYDANQNHVCDVDEGIAGLTVYATDQRTAAVLGQALTDAGGVAQLTVRVPRDDQIIMTVPYFGAQQTTGASRGQLQPVIVTTPAPVPALLP